MSASKNNTDQIHATRRFGVSKKTEFEKSERVIKSLVGPSHKV
jgi:hypothetical protein